jgi:hypothetical protein
MLAWIIEHKIGTVILAGHWVAYTEKHKSRRLTDRQSPRNYSMQDNAEVFARGLERLLDVLDSWNVQVYLLDDVPECMLRPSYALASAQRLGLDINACLSNTQYEAQQASATQIFARLQQRHPVKILRPQAYLCESGLCAITHDGECLYADQEHISEYGAQLVEPVLESVWQRGWGESF